MSFSEWSNNKKKKKTSNGTYFSDWSNAKHGITEDEKESALSWREDEIAPVKDTEEDEKWYQGWFSKGAFEDGYQVGDVTKTILGTYNDVGENLWGGIVGMGEKIVDTGAYLVQAGATADLKRWEALSKSGAAANAFGYEVGKGVKGEGMSLDRLKENTQKNIERADDVFDEPYEAVNTHFRDFIEKDLYDEKKVGHAVHTFLDPTVNISKMILGNDFDYEKNSVIDDKTEGLIQSGAELGVTMGLQALGVPWWLTTGVTSFGGAVDEAYKEDATFEEAGISAAITAGAEILTERIAGVKFGGKTLTDLIPKGFLRKISSKTVRTLAKLGVDAVGEGSEEVLSGLMSAIGQKLTYADEKEFSELFSLDEAFENFIGGAVLGGGFGAVNVGSNIVQGKDPISGLTKEEDSVIKKVYEDAVAEKEKEKGSKLTNKEKNELYDSVVKRMDEGDISIDTIEETLGGEDYKAYRDTIDVTDKLTKRVDELGAKTQPTLAEQFEFTNLVKRVDESKAKVGEARAKLDEKIRPLLGNSRLTESYNERARRGQAFEADLTQYTGKQRVAVERAIKSGVLNNTRRSHKLVNILSKIEADKGITFDYADNAKIKELGYAVEGKIVNGFVKDGAVTLNIQSPKAWQSTVGHEISHILEGTEAYSALQKSLFAYAESKGELASRRAALTELYANMDADIDAELTADLVGEYLFNDSNFVKHLTTDRNLFQKIYDEVKYLCKVATGKELTEIEKVKREFDKAWKELDTVAQSEETSDSNVKFSVREEAPPKETGIAYKVFYVKDGKLYPPMVANPNGADTPMGVWLNADVGTAAPPSKTGRAQVKAGGKGTQGGSGSLAFRPGWHLGDLPRASQFDRVNPETGKKELFPENFVWAEVEYAKDIDYQEEAMSYGYTENGKFRHAYAGLPKLPENGYYRYRTNPKPDTVPWVITGAMKVNRLLSDAEVNEILEKNGVEPVHRQGGDVGLEKFGFDESGKVKYSVSNMNNEGDVLTEEQQDFFKDSKVRDRNGNLLVLYHGTTNGGFTIFDPFMSDDHISLFLTANREVAESYALWETKEIKPNGISTGKAGVYPVYANLTNPYVIDCKGKNWNEIRRGLNPMKKTTREITKWAKKKGYDGVIFKNLVDVAMRKDGAKPPAATVVVAFRSEQVKSIHNKVPTNDPDIRYSISEDSQGNELSLAVQKRFANSKAVDENGNLKVLYHGTANGEFYTFDKSKGSVDGDFGSGFYFTDSEYDVEDNYEDGGPDFENKVARRAEQIESEEEIDYSEAEKRAREELYKGGFKHTVYLNIENPAIVGKTTLLDYESFAEEYDRNDYESDEDYEGDVEQIIADTIDEIIWDIDRNIDIYSTDGIAEVLWEAVNDGGIGIEQLKAKINELYLEDNNGNFVGNEVTRQIIESLGYDGIIDNTVSSKFNMNLEEGTTHYIAFKPNQIKSIDNQNPTDDPDIRYSVSNNLDNGQNLVYNDKRGEVYARTDEFRSLQAECQGMSDEDIQLYHSGSKQIDDGLRANLTRVLRSQIDTYRNGLRNDDGILNLTNKGNEFNMCKAVDGTLFHDVFEIAQKYLRNGELVDLHTVETTEDGIGYNDCYNYLSEDGLSGFSITPDGDLISVFNANGKGGFLGAIAPVVKENAKTLDCYNSPNQPLRGMYEKTFGFKTASIMDYNMEYDHDNIAKNHGMPQIAFMVKTESEVETKHFTKDQYDEAVAYRNGFVMYEDIAPVKNSLSNIGDQPSSVGTPLQDLYLAPAQENVAPTQAVAENAPVEDVAPMAEETPMPTDADAPPVAPTPDDIAPTTEETSEDIIKTVRDRLNAKLENSAEELENTKLLRDWVKASYDNKIAKLQSTYDSKKNKDTKVAVGIKSRIENLKRVASDLDADLQKRISDIESRISKTNEKMESPPKKDILEVRYERINKQLELDKATLAENFAKRKSDAEKSLADRPAYIQKKALELYREVQGMRKGVRVSKELGYLLDNLDLSEESKAESYHSLRTALLNIKSRPNETVNQRSAIESVAREMLETSYENDVYALNDMDNQHQKEVERLEKDAEKQRESARKEEEKVRRSALYSNIIDNVKATFRSVLNKDFDDVIKKAKNLSTFSTVDNTPQRVMEKALGYKEGQTLADLTVNKVAQNETEGIKWLNSFTDRKNGVLAQLSKKYNIKPKSKESAAAQMYAEGFYVKENNDIVAYGDAELAQDFPDVNVRNNIKGLAKDPIIRQIYDETLNAINESRTRNAYPEIQRLDNYFLHFRAMDDTFSRLGLPFNPNDIRAKDLPTDLNGVTADLKPGQPYFASANHRMGKRTSFDLLGGLENYLTSAKNQIYHIDDIQTLRALRNYIADTYGQANGLEGIDALTEEEAQEKIEQVYGSHLSTFAKFLNEEANVLAGKTALIDRGLEGVIGRRGMTFLDTVNRQVGSNMVGFNVSSSLTNFIPVAQTFAKTNKFDFIKAFAQTTSNKFGSIFGKGDAFAKNSPVAIRRKGADRFYRTPFQKVGDAGYVLMSAVDSISTELIARTKYNELTRKGMDEQKAHYETDKWVSRLMGDRSLGQMPQLYNSKTLGIITKFQLEVRNQLDSQFYDTIQEAKVSTEQIENGLARNAVTAAKVTSTFVQLAVAQHLFGQAFESVAGYNPAFDIISVLATMFGFDDDDDSEDTALDNIEQGFLELLEDLPYTSAFTGGGRIPISSALPIKEVITGKDSYGNEKNRLGTIGEALPYYLLPGGYGQIKKTAQGLSMFNTNEDHPIAGSYTDSGSLRFPVEDNLANKVQAGIFGQYASQNAREYFDNGYAPLKENQIDEFMDVEMPIGDYWKYREGLSGLKTNEEKADYINSLDIKDWQKNLLMNNILDRKEDVDMSNYGDYGSWEEFDFAQKNPEKYALSKVTGGYDYYKGNTEALYDIKADKDADGKSISGSRKEKVIDYINRLDAPYEEKIILFKSEYPADDTYNADIINYINSRDDLTYEERIAIYTELGFTVKDGYVYWD